jgi:hypothetical protein
VHSLQQNGQSLLAFIVHRCSGNSASVSELDRFGVTVDRKRRDDAPIDSSLDGGPILAGKHDLLHAVESIAEK